VVDLHSPANATLLAHLGGQDRLDRSVSVAKARPSCPSSEVDDPYQRLGAHPDLVTRLWDELGGILPEDCRWVVYGTPTLVRSASGVVFAFANGTHTYALRLPLEMKPAALAAGATTTWEYPAYPKLRIQASLLDLATVGPEWVFGRWLKQEGDWCRAAYECAAAHER